MRAESQQLQTTPHSSSHKWWLKYFRLKKGSFSDYFDKCYDANHNSSGNRYFLHFIFTEILTFAGVCTKHVLIHLENLICFINEKRHVMTRLYFCTSATLNIALGHIVLLILLNMQGSGLNHVFISFLKKKILHSITNYACTKSSQSCDLHPMVKPLPLSTFETHQTN